VGRESARFVDRRDVFNGTPRRRNGGSGREESGVEAGLLAPKCHLIAGGGDLQGPDGGGFRAGIAPSAARGRAGRLVAGGFVRRHAAVAVKLHALRNHDHWRLNVSDHARRDRQLHALLHSDVAYDLSLDDDGIGGDIGPREPARPDGQRSPAENLAVDRTIHHGGAAKDTLPRDS